MSANISTLFTEWSLLERPAAAVDAGFQAVEMQFPYVERAEPLAAACRKAGVPMILINLPSGHLGRGEIGIACLPARSAEFSDGLCRGTGLRSSELPRRPAPTGLAA